MNNLSKEFVVGKAVQIDKTAENGKTYVAVVEAVHDDGTLAVEDWGTLRAADVRPAQGKAAAAVEHHWQEQRRARLIKECQTRARNRHIL